MKWLFLNAKQRLQRIATNPGYAAKAMLREVTWADERFLAKITGERVSRIRQFIDEPAHTPEFLRHISECEKILRTTRFESADVYAKKVLIQYAIVRALRPETIVETGVANGVSSAHMLLALHKNRQGTLHSIEIGDSTYLPAGREPGWVVPDWLRGRWKFHLGDARQILPQLARELPSLDLFTHDSLHTYEHMKFEFEQAFPFLRPGGILIADDALWNDAFWDFASTKMEPNAQILHGVGSCARGSSDDCDLIASVRACTDLIAPALTDSGSGREAATKSAPALAAGALRCGSPGEPSLRSAAANPKEKEQYQ